MIEGVARAGNGFAQSCGDGEKLDGKVIRMLRGALTPDYGAFSLEIQYQKDNDEDDFVLVERVSDSLRVLELDEDDWPHAELDEEPTVFAKTTAAGQKDVEMPDDGQARYENLPTVPAPKVIQTPQNIPPLYPFSRTNVYVLISPEAAQGTIKSIVLKGSSAENPFELEIPIEVLSERSETIHQLAAKKAVAELEEGRGWLVHAKDEKGILMKDNHSASFQSMVEREAVRLGIQYQIAGKFTSFVATETDPENPDNTVSRIAGLAEKAHPSSSGSASYDRMSLFGAQYSASNFSAPGYSGAFSSELAYEGLEEEEDVAEEGAEEGVGGDGGGGAGQASGALLSASVTNYSLSTSVSNPRARDESFGSIPYTGAFSSTPSPVSNPPARGGLFGSIPSTGGDSRFSATQAQDTQTDETITKVEETDPLQKIIALQTFEGYWKLDAPLLEAVGLSVEHNTPQGVDPKVWASVLAITFLEKKMASDKESWEMLVEKARGWLKDAEQGEEDSLQEKWTLAERLIMGAD